jgi:preprotein translocase subunit SecD
VVSKRSKVICDLLLERNDGVDSILIIKERRKEEGKEKSLLRAICGTIRENNKTILMGEESHIAAKSIELVSRGF